MAKLGVVVASVRENRAGAAISDWFLNVAKAEGSFEPVLLDLKAIDLPMLNESEHPRLKKYAHAATQAWSASVEQMDAFAFVTPEYNHGTPPALVNALDMLYQEWNYKPACLVSYGGVSAGLRSAAMTKSILTTLKVVPIVEAVAIPNFPTHIDKESGRFTGSEGLERSAGMMLKELARWEKALRTLR